MTRLFFPCLLLLCLFAGTPAQAEIRLVTSIRPLQLIAAAIVGEQGTPQALLPVGASAHHYALRPSDVRQLQAADLFYWIGPDLETFLPDLLARRGQPSPALETLPGLTRLHVQDGEGHQHAHGSLDPHLWLMPDNARLIARRMMEDLVRLDPQQAGLYRHNLQRFETRLQAVERAIRQQLQPISERPYFVFHPAYGYFEAHFGLQPSGSFGLNDELQPGARHIAELRQKLQAADPSCVFSEVPAQPKLARTLTQGLPVTLAVLDPMGSSIPVDADGYPQLLLQLSRSLVECLQAPPAP